MSLDDYIGRLTTTITHELQAPIEQSLRVLLGEVLEASKRDREEAVRALEAQLATLRADYEAAESRTEAEREALLAEHAAALSGLREEVSAEVRQAVLAEAEQSAREQRAAAEEALRAELSSQRESAEEALCAQLLSERQVGEQALRQDLLKEREAGEQALREELTREREAAEQALREQHERELAGLKEQHERELAQFRDEVTAEVGQMVLSEARRAALEEQAAAEQALRAELMAERETALQTLRSQLLSEWEASEQALRGTLASEYDERLEEARARAAAAQGDGPVQPGVAAAESPLDGGVLETFRRLDRSSSLTDVLGALLDHASHEARSAIFIAAGGRIRSWRQAGFGGTTQPDVNLPLHEAGAIGLAAQTADLVSTSEYRAEESSLPAWLVPAAGEAGLAVPISVGGRAVAVLYAAPDGAAASSGAGARSAEKLEVLARHAGRCLEVLTIARVSSAAGADQAPHEAEDVRRSGADGPVSDSVRQEESARRYARLLISELKLYNEAAVEEGRRNRDLLARLGPEVERARRLYEEKIPAVVRERAGWFDEELVRTLAGGDASMLGQVT